MNKKLRPVDNTDRSIFCLLLFSEMMIWICSKAKIYPIFLIGKNR